ncbi:non-LTR retroelement reverse transcriptase-like protein [Cucumis melo var. makuwa]|uniref:Non-LTR retroelement reverse transcriptase-like protein n=1 Tax=Cucumis melo var. makuwa TaxID=1194695 RepID=A0A5A7V5J2_CUCMM|nr:non-LTR retroelement reverse transcriptase-like protein [Cucumis melo var. makuwa]TYK22520.1 non-LTR retroelement reverse transcriptase-like protein [Cucumis melo var. makuwa]
MPTITILENDLICFQFRRPNSVEWILSRGPWHLGGKPMLLRKWTLGIVPESFVFNSVPVWIRLGRIPMELWTEAWLAIVASVVGKPITLDLATKEHSRLSYARVCVKLEGEFNMRAEITVNLRGVDFNVSVNYEWKPQKCNLCCAIGHSGGKCPRSVESKIIQEEVVSKIIPGKGEGVDSEPCAKVVLESFKQLEEGEIRSSPNRHGSHVEKEVGKRDEFTLVTRKKSELVSVRDRGKSIVVAMPNSFGSLLEVGDVDKWALTVIEGSPPPLQVDEGTGVLSDLKSKAVSDFLGSSSVGFCCLLETRVRESNFDYVSRRFGNSWDYSCSYSNSGVGRIWVVWKKNRFSFSTCVVDEQFVTGTLTDLLSGVCVEVFCVYASNSNIERRLLWRRLVEITSCWSSPEVVMGDFNAIRVHFEAFGGSPIQGEMEDFDLATRDADLVEPSVQGNWFTWTSKVHGSGMLRRLDRILVNDEWLSAWPTLLVLQSLVEDPSFIEVVARMWGRHEGVSPLVSLMRNLQNLKPTLRRRFGRHIQSLNEEVHIAKENMDRAQREVEHNPMSDVLSRQVGLATEAFWTAVRLEEASLRQKSRIRWLELGDQNTAFFHRPVRSRMSRNSLLSLVDADGSRVSSHDGVVQLAVNYFRNSLGSQEIGYRELFPVIDDIVQFRWSEECCQALQIPISREEVRRVLFSMDSGKAPGPDGFSVGFFKGAWSVVEEDFCDVVLHFFETCYLPIGVNATVITLIPKRRGAEQMEEFRPISCCNVIYKCISKILADRLRVWLPSFIGSNQSAFIPGRSIIDNILLCQELVEGYHLNSGKPRCTLKVDLQKAYDSVNWDFLKGVRQGDPLSPFLFVMVMEVLSRMLNKIPQSFKFHHRCEKVKLTHLTFADDLMIFCAADEPSLSNEAASHLAASMGFVLGNLPVRYLGLPLLTGRLRSNDCAPLIQRITSRIRSWTAGVLSFAGRLQLVRSVLRSLQVYWTSVFLLPVSVHNEVDEILRSYLWRGKEEGRGGIKVAWVERRNRADLKDFRCSSQENASENDSDSVFSSWCKKWTPDGFFPLLRIGHKSFDLRGSYSEDFNPHSWHAPDMFSGDIGREAILLEKELCEGNGLTSRTSSARPKKTRARMPRTQFSQPGAKSGLPTVSSLCSVLVISLSIFGARTPRTSTHTPGMLPDTEENELTSTTSGARPKKTRARLPWTQFSRPTAKSGPPTVSSLCSVLVKKRARWRKNCVATQNGLADGQCFQRVANARPVSETTENALAAKQNGLTSMTSRARPKKTRARMPRTQFFRPGEKCGPPTISSLCSVLVISLPIFRARTLRTSTHTPGMVSDTFFGGIGWEASWLEGELCEVNGLSSKISSARPMKTRARMPRTQFSRPGAKSGPPTVSSLCSVLVISLSIFGARTLRTSTHTSGMLPDTFSGETTGNALQRSKRPELKDFRCSSQENANEIAPDSIFSSLSKKRSPDVFFSLLRREASSLEEELWCDLKRSKRWPMFPTNGERSSGVRNHWKCTCSEGNGLNSRTSGASPKKTRARMPRSQFSRSGAKSDTPTVSSLCFVLVINLSIFEARTPRTSTHTTGMLPDMFSRGIGQEASSLEGELWCNPKRSKRWTMLPTSVERSSGIRNHLKCTRCEGNGLSSRTLSAHPKKTRARMPRTQFSRAGAKSGPQTVSSLCSVLVGKRARWWGNCGATKNGLKDGQCFQRVGKRSSGVRNHWKYTCSEGNGLRSRTFSACPKKTRARMPRTQFSSLGAKSGPPTVSSLCSVLVRKRARWRANCGATQNGPKDGQCFQRVGNARPVSETTGNALAVKKRAELKDFWCSSQENAFENVLDSVFSSWGKKQSPDGFFPLRRIGHKSIDPRGSYSEDFNPYSWHAP